MDDVLSGAAARAAESSSGDTMSRIRKVFVQAMRLGIAPEDLSYKQLLEEMSILDSIAVLEFVAALEREFGVSLAPKVLDFDFLSDLPALASYLETHAGPRSSS